VVTVSVCLSVCVFAREHIAVNYTSDLSPPTFVHVSGHGSVLIWRRCDMLCTSCFMDDVTFADSGQEQTTRKKRIGYDTVTNSQTDL